MNYNYRYGGFFQRAASMLIDVGILLIFYLVLFVVDASLDSGGGYGRCALYAASSSQSFLFFLTAIFGSVLYFTYFHSATGQTIGKRLMGLKVVTIYGEPLSVGKSFLRCCGYIISKWIFFLGFIWVAISKTKRGWHDYIAGTMVIRLGVEEPSEK